MKKVILSSTLRDLEDVRTVVIAAIRRAGFDPAVCEDWPASDRGPEELSVSAVREAKVYICIIGARYGTPASGDDPRSFTEIEFDEATELKRKRLVFVESRPRTDGSEEAIKQLDLRRRFVDRIKASEAAPTLKMFIDITDLIAQLVPALFAAFGTEANAKPRSPAYVHEYSLLRTEFVGRVGLRKDLSVWATRADGPALFALVAFGGMGKSALAWTWWNDEVSRPESPWLGSVWFSFYETDATYHELVSRMWSYASGQSIEESRKIPLDNLERDVLDVLRSEAWLIILDGFEAALILSVQIDYQTEREDGERPPPAMRKLHDRRLNGFLEKLRDPAKKVRSRILITTRFFPADLEQVGTLRPIAGVERRELKAFDVAESKQLWAARGLDPEDPDLAALSSKLEGYPLALLVMSSAFAESLAPSLKEFFEAHPDFNPLREGITHDTARSDVFHRALLDLSTTERDLLKTIAFLPFPIGLSFLRRLLPRMRRSGIDQGLSTSGDVGNTLHSLRARALVSIGRQIIEMHPVVRGVVKVRERAGSAEAVSGQLVRALRSIPRSEEVTSLSDLDYDVNLAACLVSTGAFEEASFLIATDGTRPVLQQLARLGGARTSAMLLMQFFDVDRTSEPPNIRFKAANDRSFAQRRSAESDFTMKLGTSHGSAGDHRMALAFYAAHRACGVCKDPLCITTDRRSLEAEGRFATSAQILRSALEKARRTRTLSPYSQDRLESLVISSALEGCDTPSARIALLRRCAVMRTYGELTVNYKNQYGLRRAIWELNLDVVRIGMIEGAHGASIRCAESILKEAAEAGDVPLQRDAVALIGELELARSRPRDAEAALSRSIVLASEVGGGYSATPIRCLLAEAISARGNHEHAHDVARDAFQWARSANDVAHQARASLTLARVAGGAGNADAERNHLFDVVAAFMIEAGVRRGWRTLDVALKRLSEVGASGELSRRGWGFAPGRSVPTQLLNPQDQHQPRKKEIDFEIAPLLIYEDLMRKPWKSRAVVRRSKEFHASKARRAKPTGGAKPAARSRPH